MNNERFFVFNCLVFGRYFTNSFLDYLLDSLIYAKIEEFSHQYRILFIITTGEDEKKVIENHSNYIYLSHFVTFEYQTLTSEEIQSNNNYRNVLLMKKAHKFAAARAQKENCLLGIFVPDMMVNTNYFTKIHESINSGVDLLLAPALRMSYLDQFLLNRSNSWQDFYQSPKLIENALVDLHQETKSFLFTNSEFLRYQSYQTPTAVLFKHKIRPNTYIGFGMSWYIAFVDFSRLTHRIKHKIQKSLSQHTIDMYVIDSISQQKGISIEIVSDSDQMFIMSWDRKKPTMTEKNYSLQIEMNSSQKCDLITIGILSGLYDNFKILNFTNAFYWNGTSLKTDTELTNYEIDPTFQKTFLEVGALSLKPGIILYLRKLHNFAKSVRYNYEYESPKQISKGLKKFLRKTIRLFRILSHLITYKLTMQNPLNQPLGNRILAATRLMTYYYLNRKAKLNRKV